MSTEGIEAIFLETHNWGKAANFFQELGYAVEFETDHNSGQLRNGVGPTLFIAEVPETEPTRPHLVLTSPMPTHSNSTAPSRSSTSGRTPIGEPG